MVQLHSISVATPESFSKRLDAKIALVIVVVFINFLTGCTQSESEAVEATRSANEKNASRDFESALEGLPQPLPGRWSPIVGKTVKPFWRKGDAPTYAPDWYFNRGEVTDEIAQRDDETDTAAGLRLHEALGNLKPGDHLLIREGVYSVDRWLTIRARGTANSPISIRGAPGETVVITRPDAEKNVIDIDESQYLVLESLQIRGGSNAVKIYAADHVLLYGLTIENSEGAAIAANSKNTSYLSIIDCEISHTGGNAEGIYLGGSNGSVVTHHAAIVGNFIHDLVGPSVKQGDGIEIKQGSYANWIKYNFVQNTNYPGIIVYGTSRGGDERNVIEENIVIDSHDYAVQASADAVIRNNLIINSLPGKRAFVSKPEPGSAPSDLFVVNNTFLARGRAVTCSGWDGSEASGIVFANNAYYSESAEGLQGTLGQAIAPGNVYVKSLRAFANVDMDAEQFDATPRENSPLIGAGENTLAPSIDLMGMARPGKRTASGARTYLSNRSSGR